MLCGPLDQNLRLVEQRLGVAVHRRGNQFRVQGERSAGAERVLRDLFDLAGNGGNVDLPDVHLALREHDEPSDGTTVRAGEAHHSQTQGYGQAAEDVARVPRGLIRARGPHQKTYMGSVRRHDLTFGIGPAGTGKTYLAVACAVEALHSERVRRIVLVRPAVEAGERLGFLPGDLTQKVDPYLRPMYDALYEMMGFDRVARLIERNVIEIAPLAFMRGRSLNESFIILDEAQNTTPEQMKMFLTRIGFGSRAVVTGDLTQTDLPEGRPSGLREALRLLSQVDGVAFSHFDAGDIVRHPLVQRIVQAYEAGQR
jgi:phosphate starvation-inducible PhoH-like protein